MRRGDGREGQRRETVSVVVVTFNAARELHDCLTALSRQTSDDLECIVVDNASSDIGSLEGFDIQYLRLDHNYGLSYGRNYGVARAKGDVVLFLDDDSVARRDLVDVVAKTFREDQSVVGIRGRVVPRHPERIFNALAHHYDLGGKSVAFPLVTECNCAVRRQDLLDIGGFETKLFGHEGLELSYRLRERGRLIYVPDAVVYHDFGDNLRHFLRKEYRHSRNSSRFARESPEVLEYWNTFKYPAEKPDRQSYHRFNRFELGGLEVLSQFARSAGEMAERFHRG